MYQLTLPMKPSIEASGSIRLSDNAFIPFDIDNTDYQEYLKWVEAGNTPEPADESENSTET